MPSIKHILFPFDFSGQGSHVAPFVRAMATRFNAKVTLYSVVPPTWELPPAGMRPLIGDNPAEWTGSLHAQLEEALTDDLAGIAVERVADSGDPAFRIRAFADTHGVDLIMMPTHGLGLFRGFLMGSVTAKVLHDAKCPVWTAAHAEAQRSSVLPRRVLCAVDGTPKTPALLQWAGAFSAGVGATLTLLHVVGRITDGPFLASERELQEEIRKRAHDRIDSMQRSAGVNSPLRVAVGEIGPTVTEEARQEHADLVIIGRGAISEPFGRLRTHAFGIIQLSACPVLSV